MSVSFCFVSEGQTTQPMTVTGGQIMTERNSSLPFSGELDNGHCNAPLPVEETERLGSSNKVCFLKANLAENISSI
jgi:hypothetical protein